jgi:methyl-accepting chemotaxis protein
MSRVLASMFYSVASKTEEAQRARINAEQALDRLKSTHSELERSSAEARSAKAAAEAAVEGLRVAQEAERQSTAKQQTLQERISKEQTQVVNALAGGLSRLSQRDLTCRLTHQVPEAFKGVVQDFNAAVEQFGSAISALAISTDGLRSGANEIAGASGEMAQRTEQQATNLEELVASLADVGKRVGQTAELAVQARSIVTAAKSNAETTGSVVENAISAMGKIEKSSEEIRQIIGVIDEIAFQTNLLALNAGVEAARAGDSGRGFAVVASEVRALAQRAANAAKEIKKLIETSRSEVNQGAKHVALTGTALTEITRAVTNISDVVLQISDNAESEATELKAINATISQLDTATQQNASMAEEVDAATRTLNDQVSELSKMFSRFQVAGRSGQIGTLPQPRSLGQIGRRSS